MASLLKYLFAEVLNVMHLSVKCLFMGHEDYIRGKEHRMFLTCAHCGRETHGWEITAHDERKPSTMHEAPQNALA